MKYVALIFLCFIATGCGMHNMKPPYGISKTEMNKQLYDCNQSAAAYGHNQGYGDNIILNRIDFQDCLQMKYGWYPE